MCWKGGKEKMVRCILTWNEWQIAFVETFAVVHINKVEADCFVLHTNLTLLGLSNFYILPLQNLQTYVRLLCNK